MCANNQIKCAYYKRLSMVFDRKILILQHFLCSFFPAWFISEWTLLYERFFFSLFWVFISVSITSVSVLLFSFTLLKKKPEHECFVRSPRVLMYTCIHVQTVEVSKSRIYYLISLSFAVTQVSLHILVSINEMQSKWQWQWHSI